VGVKANMTPTEITKVLSSASAPQASQYVKDPFDEVVASCARLMKNEGTVRRMNHASTIQYVGNA
jgi:hypothetical protein